MYLFEFVCQMTSLLGSMKVSYIGPKTKSSIRPLLHSTMFKSLLKEKLHSS